LFYFDNPSVISAQHNSLLSLMAYVHFIHKCVSMLCVSGHSSTVMLADNFSRSSSNEVKTSTCFI